jgi:beta-glucosidase
VSQSRIDDAVARILRIKYQMGLFNGDATDPQLTTAIGSPAHREVARECVRESLVLLKNTNHTLPLSRTIKHLVVVGEAADDLGVQCGGWTIDWQGRKGAVTHGGTTLLAALKNAVPADTTVTYSADGSELSGADAVVVVVGEDPYAEMKGDRQDLDLPDGDKALVARAKATGAPVITVLYSGRPLVLGSALRDSDAFVAAWLPGTEGEGMADVLLGENQFTGTLPRNWPQSNEQLASLSTTSLLQFKDGFGLKN